MNKLYRFFCFLPLAACCGFAAAGQALAAADPALSAQFQQQFNAQLQSAKVPGGAYAIVYQDRVLALGSYGVRAVGEQARVNPDTVFRLASVSKTFAGNLLVQLSQQGRLDLQQPLKAYVPELHLKNAQIEQQVNVESVLSQGSGFWAHAFEDLIEANKTPAEILPRLAELAPVCPPRRCYSYQNVLFGLLGRAAEQSTGKSYESLVTERMFSPLQMHNASYGLAGLLASRNKALPHERGGKGWRTVKPKPNFYRFPAAAGVNASARDLSKYLIAMLGHRPEVFSPALLSQLQQPLVKMPGKPRWPVWQQYRNATAWYGRGWRMVQYGDDRLYYHAGVVDGYRPYIAYSPSTGYGLVLLTNAEADVTGKLAGWFWQQVLPGPQLAKQKQGTAKKGAK
ncbi:serine hydrolase domain-containing protein [Rheinheimera texasensis]|uniref:serine hydrolase domain-containing protein n=1 Tax=Rheinheimera texasensis TaxID=306205 RepID=UPI000AD348E8|nr:serine hydrolase domain-containing protein [Rheinheimera texasensis]